MVIFSMEGEAGLTGIWTAITTARALDPLVLNIPKDATHYVRYTTGSTAQLRTGEVLTGGTSNATVLLVGQAIENGTIGGTNQTGILFVRKLTGTPTATGETWTGVTTGTVVTAQEPLPILYWGPPRAALITVEAASINFTMDGTTPTVAAGTNYGHVIPSGGSYGLKGWNSIKKFKAINTADGNNAILKYTLLY